MRVGHNCTIRREGGRGSLDRVEMIVASSHYRRVVAKARRRTIQDNTVGLGEDNGWAWEGAYGISADNWSFSLICGGPW